MLAPPRCRGFKIGSSDSARRRERQVAHANELLRAEDPKLATHPFREFKSRRVENSRAGGWKSGLRGLSARCCREQSFGLLSRSPRSTVDTQSTVPSRLGDGRRRVAGSFVRTYLN